MKKVFDFFIGAATVILMLAGIILIMTAFNGKYGDVFDGILAGVECFASIFILYGFYIIVDAAYIYIEKSKEAEE